jgi:type I restriction enzyme, S subunit
MQDLLTKVIDAHGNIRPEAAREFKDSPLGRIPKDWEVLRVEEVGSVRLGRQRSPKHQSGRFTTPYLRVANVFDGWIDYTDVLSMDFTPTEKEIYGLLAGDILLNEGQSLELVGRSAMYEGEPNQYCFQNTLVRFRAFDENDPGYCQMVFKFWLDTGRFRDVARQTTSVAHLGADRFAQMPFPRPSLEEQQAIYSVLKAKDDVIRAQQGYLQILHRVKTGLTQDLLTKGIDEHGNIRSEATHEFKDSPLGKIPKEWDVVTIESLLYSAVDGPFGSNLKSEHYVDDPGVRVVRLQNIGQGVFNNKDKAYISSEHALKLQRHQVKAGDLVVASLGDATYPIARSCLYPHYLPPGIVKADCFRLRLKPHEALNAYLMHVLNCASTREDINLLGQGVTRDRINLATMKLIRVRKPPIREQSLIVKTLEASSNEIETSRRNLEKLKSIKQGLMQDLLTGAVGVASLLDGRD